MDKKNPNLAVAQMRESIGKLASSAESYEDLTLMRFLITTSMDASKAAKMFVQWQKWRASFVPLNYIPETEIQHHLSTESVYLQGRTSKGQPLLIIKVNKHFPAKDQLQFKKFLVYCMDKTVASSFRGEEIGNEKSIAIVDMQQSSYKNVDVRGAISGFQILQSYYPERLAKMYLINMPGFFIRAWKIMSCVLEKSTLEKVVIVGNEEARRELVRDVGEEVLPQEYGGRAKLVLIQHFEFPPLDY